MKNSIKLLPSGQHLLVFRNVKFGSNGAIPKAYFIFEPIPQLRGFNIVQRTYTIGSSSYETALTKFGAKIQSLTEEEVKKLCSGIMICCELVEAKKPGYMDIKKIHKVYRRFPEDEVLLYLKGFHESNNRTIPNEEILG